MRKFFLASFVLVAALCMATSGFALEKTARPIADTLDSPGWSTAGGTTTCAAIYYNRCTLWSYAWSGFGIGDRLGVCADNCCPGQGLVSQTALRVFTGAPAGYGFTGTASITNVDSHCCPTNTLASQPWLPTGPFDVHNWAQPVGAQFAVVYTYSCLSGAGSPVRVGTDHPSAGPTGPQACGFCYPLDRPNHSYYWGSDPGDACAGGSPAFCPGLTFLDLTPAEPCAPQLRLDIFMVCQPVAVDPQSWGGVKSLYR